MKAARTGLDPRTKIVVLVTVIIVVFSFPGNLVMGITVAGCILLFLIDGLVLQLVGFAAVYLFLTAIQFLLLPRVGATAAMMLAGFVYFKVLMPIALPADYLMRTTSVQEVLAAAKKNAGARKNSHRICDHHALPPGGRPEFSSSQGRNEVARSARPWDTRRSGLRSHAD